MVQVKIQAVRETDFDLSGNPFYLIKLDTLEGFTGTSSKPPVGSGGKASKSSENFKFWKPENGNILQVLIDLVYFLNFFTYILFLKKILNATKWK